MPFTFGAATTDDMSWTGLASVLSTAGGLFASCWIYPTTLTAGRCIWGNANTYALKVGTTTSELQVVTDHTTDGVHNTSGAGITVDKWWFVAVALQSISAQDGVLVWRGDLENAPVNLSVSAGTSPVGAPSGSTIMAIGNQGSSGSVAFQGDIDSFYFRVATALSTTGTDWSQITTAGTFPASSEEFIRDRYVLPMWRANQPYCFEHLNYATNGEQNWVNLSGSNGALWRTGRNGSSVIHMHSSSLTPAGAAVSLRGSARPIIYPAYTTYVRR